MYIYVYIYIYITVWVSQNAKSSDMRELKRRLNPCSDR